MKRIGRTLAILVLIVAGCGEPDDGLNEPTAPPMGPPPEDPAELAQYNTDGTTPLPWGALTGDDQLVFSARVAPAGAFLEVEVVQEGMPFTGTPSGRSSDASGDVVRVRASVPEAGTYSWRARVTDSHGRASGFVAASAGPAFTRDPFVPSLPSQTSIGGATIAPGGTTTEVGVALKAIVRSPQGNLVRAQFEVKPVGVPFDGSDLLPGSVVSSGQSSTAVAFVSPASYHWRVQAEDYTGPTSAWVEYADNDGLPDFVRDPITAVDVPSAPTSLFQAHTDSVSGILMEQVSEENVVLSGFVASPANRPCALEVEVKSLFSQYSGAGTVVGPYVASNTTAFTAVPVTAGPKTWRARTVDSLGLASEWVWYGTGTGGDFGVSSPANTPPSAPTFLRQYQGNGWSGMSAGEVAGGNALVLKADLTDPDYGNGLVLQVEVKPTGVPFADVPSAVSPVVRSASTASTSVQVRYGFGYHWRARTVDQAGTASTWIEYAGSTTSEEPPPSYGGGGGCGGTVAVQPPTWIMPVALIAVVLALVLRRQEA